jgi:multisubunit Na+/H+ antiporter MnhB subunit
MRAIVTAVVVLVLSVGVLSAAVGLDFGSPLYTDMDDYFINFGQVLTGGNNIVTDVVFDFRGFDTLGEATVLFTAVTGVGLAFRKRKEDEEYDYE